MIEYQSHTFPHSSGGYTQKLKRYFSFMHFRSDILVPSISFNGGVRNKLQNYGCYSFWNVIKIMNIRFNVRICVQIRLRVWVVCKLFQNSCKSAIQLPTNVEKEEKPSHIIKKKVCLMARKTSVQFPSVADSPPRQDCPKAPFILSSDRKQNFFH